MRVSRGLLSGAALALATLLPNAAAAAPPDNVSRLLDQSRAALGAEALSNVKVLELKETTSVGGLPGTSTQWLEIGGMRFSEFASNPPVVQDDGYDGKESWLRDGTGLVWVDGGTLGRSQEISIAFASDYALWSPNRGGATVNWIGEKTAAGRTYDVLEITAPGSSVAFDLYFDRTTHLPARMVQTAGPVTATTVLSNYRRAAGLMIPYSIHSEQNGNAVDVSVQQVIENPDGGPLNLTKPPSTVRDFSIAGSSETSVPIHLGENHVYLNVMLNGKGPYRFIFDTGGQNLVDPAVAREIGAAGVGSMQGSGAGSQTEGFSFAKVATLQVGNATLKDQLFAVAPTRMGFGVSAGQPVDGLIGFEVLSRFVTTFDYANNRVILQMPGTSEPPAGSDVIPFVFNTSQPQFPCAIDDIAAQCTLDTGARDSLTLYGPFIASHPQIVPQTMSQVGVNGFGFGGAALGKLGRLQSLTIGTFTLPGVVADFTAQQQGALAAPFVGANVGGNILKKFSMRLDYANQTMALTANASLNDPDVYERAGLFLVNKAGKYVVLDVRPGTASARAGIAKGDTIDSIDGKPASSMSLEALRGLFFAAPGTTYQIGLTTKDGTQKQVALTLQNFI